MLKDYTGEFEIVGNLKVDQIRQTHIRFRKMDDFEAYINAIDEGYDADDTIFIGYIDELNTRQFNKVNRSQKGNGCDFEHEILKIEVTTVSIKLKDFVFLNVLISQQVKIIKNNILILSEMEKDDQII